VLFKLIVLINCSVDAVDNAYIRNVRVKFEISILKRHDQRGIVKTSIPVLPQNRSTVPQKLKKF